jgi:hypothetical protein
MQVGKAKESKVAKVRLLIEMILQSIPDEQLLAEVRRRRLSLS